MRKLLFISFGALLLPACSSFQKDAFALGRVEGVASLPFRPGNVCVTAKGRVFATSHPLDGENDVQLFEVTGPDRFQAWPSEKFQSPKGRYGENTIDTPLGITKDGRGGLWVVDMGQRIGKTRVWGFDIASGELIKKIDLPASIAPVGSFVQDLAVDRENGWVYLADIANPGILVVELATGAVRRFGGHPSFEPEKDAKMEINGKAIFFGGAPASVGINPITLSADGETLFYGAMSGTSWYGIPARLFRGGASDGVIANSIVRVGDKPVSDGAATDSLGNHFFTNLNQNGIDKLSADGILTPLVRDARFDWPDNVSVGDAGWLYVAVNQLHKAPAFTGAGDEGRPPYRIYRVWADAR